ncbi:MAG: UvrD-helicase domain-containing protein [Bryobacteraceae bacterium]
MDFLQGLNPNQREAVCHVNGPLLILAGAGSGKTRVVTHRIAQLVGANQVPPEAVLAVTFTNKAAGEMRQRVMSLIGTLGYWSSPLISTFHSFGVRLLRRDGASLADIRTGFTPQFTIYDDDDQLAIVKAVFRHLGLDEQFMQYRAALSRISYGKNHQETPEDLYKAPDPKIRKLAVVFGEYEGRLRQANALDFDDLLLETVRLLRYDEETRRRYNERFQHVLVDEYQDTNRCQYDLMRLLTEARRNICVVGDEDQSIYGWRGADIRNILDFERDFPHAKVIRLEQNYRSTKHILAAAGAVVSHNEERKGKTLWTDGEKGDLVGFFQADDGEQEALFVADRARRILDGNPEDRVAVLYRTNSQSRQIEEAFRRQGVKYLVVGGLSFYHRAEIKDALAYLKFLLSPGDSVSLLRIINTPARGIGRTTVEQIEHYAVEQKLTPWAAICRMLDEKLVPARAEAALTAFRKIIEELRAASVDAPVHRVLSMILDRTGYLKTLEQSDAPESEGRIENLNELLNAAAEAAERGESASEFLDHAALVAEVDELNGDAPVLLLTLHNAKGLEFPTVFIVGMEEGLFPHSRSISAPGMIEEERRLCYVGMTRARKRLFLSCARLRRKFGGGQLQQAMPSRFLSEVPPNLLENLGPRDDIPQIDLFLEQKLVRESVQRTAYTGKTYNSVEHIRQFFGSRTQVNKESPVPQAPKTAPAVGKPVVSKPVRKPGIRQGSTIVHPKYGRGTVVRREGEGDDAKLTVSFPGYGIKKLIAKYAGLKTQE